MSQKLPNPPPDIRPGPPDPPPAVYEFPPGYAFRPNDDLDLRIARLELKPGDILAVKFERSMSLAHIERVRDLLRSCLDRAGLTNQCLVLDENATLSVISPTAETSP